MPKNRHEITRIWTSLFIDTIPLGVYNVSNLRNKEEGGATMKYDQKVMNRLKRIEGQIKGIIKMMEEDKDCKEVVTQLSASRSAIDRAIGVVVSANLVECINNPEQNGEKTEEELVQEAVELLVRSR